LFYGILYGQLILKNQHRKYLNFYIKTDLLSVYIKYIVLYLGKKQSSRNNTLHQYPPNTSYTVV